MIFITVGSQKFQFNRLLKEVDKLIGKNIITEEVFAQIGYSDYIPKNYNYKKFLDRYEFKSRISKSNIIITHGGTGAIITGLKENKHVIAVARLKKFEEHVDNHQVQIINEFQQSNYIQGTKDVNELEKLIKNINNITLKKYISNTKNIIDSIVFFLES